MEGDLNSRFFHSMASSDRKKTNMIIRLQDVDGVIVGTRYVTLSCHILLSYFQFVLGNMIVTFNVLSS